MAEVMKQDESGKKGRKRQCSGNGIQEAETHRERPAESERKEKEEHTIETDAEISIQLVLEIPTQKIEDKLLFAHRKNQFQNASHPNK